MKKGISPVMATLITMIFVLVTFFIFSALSRGGFLQEKALIAKQAEATGEIPCIRSPDVQFLNTTEGASYINPPKGIISAPQTANASLSAKVSSPCLEDLDVVWNFGDGTFVEKNCTYVPGKGYYILNSSGDITDSCTSMNHTYALKLSDIWTIKDIRLQVFGLRSAFYSEASTAGFVTDPNFNISFNGAPDISDYSCVLLDVVSNNSKYVASNGANEPINSLRLDAVDSKRIRSTDTISYLSKDEANFTYRAYFNPGGEAAAKHTVQVFATKGYQTVSSPLVTYVPPGNINPNKEILIFGNDSLAKPLDVWYNSSQAKKWKCASYASGVCMRNSFPFLKDTDLDYVAVAAGDVNLDGEDEIITLMSGDKNGEIFVFKNSDWEKTSDFHDISLDDLKDKWMHAEPAGSTWRDIAVGDNIMFDNKIIGKGIIALSDTTLALYQVQGGSVNLVDEATLPSHESLNISNWVSLTTADVNHDGEDEIIALAKGSSPCFSGYKDHFQVFVFKYGENTKIGDGTHLLDYCLSRDYNWVGIAAGDFDGGKLKDDVLVLAKGAIAWYKNVNYSDRTLYLGVGKGRILEENFPNNVDWRDVAAADINHDGVDEILALYQTKDTEGNDNEGDVCIFKWSALNAADWAYVNKDMTKLKEKTNPTCMTINKGFPHIENVKLDNDWTSIAVGDVGCFQ